LTVAKLRRALDRAASDRKIGAIGCPRNRRAFRIQAKVQRCKTSFGRLEKIEPAGHGKQIRRIRWIPLECGHRACESCGRKLREKASKRMWFPWRSTITLTVPHTIPKERAWENMSGWVSRYMSAWRKWMHEHEPDESREYAWVLEDHKSGYPHCHIVMQRDCEGTYEKWSKFADWSRKAWQDITGLPVVWWRIEKLRKASATSAYITKYLHKSSYNPWHYALIGRRRMWGTSLHPPEIISEGYRLESILDSIDLPSASQKNRDLMRSFGFRLQWETGHGTQEWIRTEDLVLAPAWIDFCATSLAGSG